MKIVIEKDEFISVLESYISTKYSVQVSLTNESIIEIDSVAGWQKVSSSLRVTIDVKPK